MVVGLYLERKSLLYQCSCVCRIVTVCLCFHCDPVIFSVNSLCVFRFMICCDRCQEWFHGDCVGISEKRGRLMEKNGEDYICPNCSPCPSPAPLQTVQTTLSATGMSSASESVTVVSTCENRPSEDEGIKGKIRKASSEGTKKKLKIFQPVKLFLFS